MAATLAACPSCLSKHCLSLYDDLGQTVLQHPLKLLLADEYWNLLALCSSLSLHFPSPKSSPCFPSPKRRLRFPILSSLNSIRENAPSPNHLLHLLWIGHQYRSLRRGLD